ncbi:hypothetical protein C7974DRAFT_377825 [Boeremia exigua]|uniref:uncharacterized protein n=1 Tax=Boeremia exigua TaxID=749465 RepID=UPI001E8E46A9|nr:uncharacterized protein C7974DRAFT_377825 [Boeremia exigua]KAH6622230.1 hypothetical protein C7974DRAFT_377825 [Boeremia exigua]
MLFQKLAIATALTALVAAQEIDQDDIPQQCTQVCAEVVTIARDCDRQSNDNAEIQCICRANNANTLLPACDACVQQYDRDLDDDNDRNDNDVREILRSCNFSVQSTFTLSSGGTAAATALPSLSATPTAGNTFVNAQTSVNAAATTAAGSQISQNAAPAVTAAAGMAGMGLGALGLALGMI